jgi:hypothetical protein
MSKRETTSDPGKRTKRGPHRVRLPGFLVEEEIGLGDAIKRVTYAIGINTCGDCEARAAALNGWLRFSRRPSNAQANP